MRTLGRYALLNRLASGNLANVFLAKPIVDEGPSVPQRFAIKLYKREHATNMRFARLLVTEGKTAARLEHRILVRLYEVEREADSLYSAMAFEAGQPLSALLRRSEVEGHSLSHRAICWIGAQLADALAVAHKQAWFPGTTSKIAHGCLSPRSALITYDGRVRLLGVGSGRARVTCDAPMSRLSYVAPELLKGLPLTYRADVYALGVSLYDALSGKRIFRRTSREGTISAIREARAPRLNSRDLQVAPEVGDLIAEMMAPRVDARPQSLEPIAEILRREAGTDREAVENELADLMRAHFQEEINAFRKMEGAVERVARSRSVSVVWNQGQTAPAWSPGEQSAAEAPAVVKAPAPRAPSEPAFDIDVETPVSGIETRAGPQALEEPEPPASNNGAHARPFTQTSQPADIEVGEEPASAPEPQSPKVEPDEPPQEARPEPESPKLLEFPEAPSAPAPKPEKDSAASQPATTTPPSWTADLEVQPNLPDLLPASRNRAPKKVGRYAVLEQRSVTSTVRVLLARDPNVGRSVLLKVLNPGSITDPRLPKNEWVRLFKREARITGSLGHPNLPVLYDAGRDAVGYFIACAPSRGELLSDVLDQGRPLSQGRIREILVDVAMALQYMHERGVMHCNLRCSGILLSRDGRARITDLSMASERSGPEHPLVSSNIYVLPPEYFVDEGFTQKADQFALGQMLYQMLLGTRPFSGLNDQDLIGAIQTSQPTPPAALDPAVDPVLSKVCMRLLEKDPEKRFESAAEIIEELLGVDESAYESMQPSEALQSGSQIQGDSRIPIPEAVGEGSSHLDGAGRSAIGPPTLIDRPLIEIGYRPFEPGPIDAFDFGDALIALCARVDGLAPQSEDFDAPRAALGLARRARAPAEIEMLAGLAVALRQLAARSALSLRDERLAPMIPEPILGVFAEVDEIEPKLDAPLVAQIVRLVELYANATSPTNPSRMSPKRALAMLTEEADKSLRRELIAALVEHLRETHPELSLSPDQEAPRILVVRTNPAPSLIEGLEYDGFWVEQATDGEIAWSMLQAAPYDGAIVDDVLKGRDGLSLLRLCRANPSTANISFLILSSQALTDLEWEIQHAGDAQMVDGASAVDVIRNRVGQLLGRPVV